MKKLIMAAAAITAGFAMADVVSSSVVGYQTYALNNGYSLYAPVFEDVGTGSTITLQDIKLVGANGDGREFICPLDANGIAGSLVYWMSAEMTGETEDCWFDMDAWAPVETLSLTEGQGFYVFTSSDDVSIQCSGQVKLGNMTIPANVGYNLVGNALPKDVDLQELKLTGANGDGREFICPLDANGIAGTLIYWMSAEMTGESEDCWFDMDAWTPVENVTVKAGEGLYLYATGEGVSLVIPQVL